MTDQLKVYNEALRACGERSLASLTEEREPRYLLDEVWNNGGVQACLEKGFWQFATRYVRLDYDTAVTPAFGYNRAFTKPTDWVKTAGLCSDEYFTNPLLQYTDENDYWFASIDELFIKYISNGNSYGNNLSLWPQLFADYVAADFAEKVFLKLSQDDTRYEIVVKLVKTRLLEAKNHDASQSPQKFPAPGGWVTSRYARSGRSRDRGNRSSLIG